MSAATSARPPPYDTYRHAYVPTIDPFIGQRFIAALVDICFFAVITIFGVRKVIGEVLIGTLLSSYAAYRFGISQGKQQAVTAMSAGGAFGQGGGGVGGAGSSGGGGSQPRMQAIRPEERVESAPILPVTPPTTVPRPARMREPRGQGQAGPNDAHHRSISEDASENDVPDSDPVAERNATVMLGLTRQ